MESIILRFFPDVGATLDYCTTELLATLNDDLNSNQDDPSEAETCAELEAKISDIEQVQPLIPELLEALRGLLRRYPESAEAGTYTPEGSAAREVLAKITGWTS